MVKSVFTGAYEQLVPAMIGVRKDAGLTQRELAQRLGREYSFVARVETSQRRVDVVSQ